MPGHIDRAHVGLGRIVHGRLCSLNVLIVAFQEPLRLAAGQQGTARVGVQQIHGALGLQLQLEHRVASGLRHKLGVLVGVAAFLFCAVKASVAELFNGA